jgi:ABC-type antimicrobial peptide transport system permease subunit
VKARKRRTRRPLGSIDAVLLGALLAVAAVGALLLWLSPAWWSNYLALLDVRYWAPWKVVGLGIALMQSLMVIRLWPHTKRQRGQ